MGRFAKAAIYNAASVLAAVPAILVVLYADIPAVVAFYSAARVLLSIAELISWVAASFWIILLIIACAGGPKHRAGCLVAIILLLIAFLSHNFDTDFREAMAYDHPLQHFGRLGFTRNGMLSILMLVSALSAMGLVVGGIVTMIAAFRHSERNQ